MRLILCLVLAYWFTNSFAQTAWFPIGKEGANTNYAEKSVCEEKEGQECFNTGTCPNDECSLVTEEVDDFTRPKFKKAYNVVSCADKTEKQCAQMVEHPEFCIEGERGYYREVGGVLEGYCTAIVGYEKKSQKALQPSEEKLREKALKEQEAQDKLRYLEQYKDDLDQQLAQCLSLTDKTPATELISCVRTLILKVTSDKLTVEDVEYETKE